MNIVLMPIERVKKNCLCCGEEMTLALTKSGTFATDAFLSFAGKSSARRMTD